MVDAETIAILLAATSPLYIPGVMKLTEMVFENLMSSRGYIRIILFHINRRAAIYFAKPEHKRLKAAGGEFEFNDHPDYMFYMRRMATIEVDAKSGKQLRVFNADGPASGPSADQLDGIARHSYNIGFRQALKKFANWEKYFILILLLALSAVIVGVFTYMKIPAAPGAA